MRTKITILFYLFLLCTCLMAFTQQTAETFTKKTEYLLFFPETYNADTTDKWPLIIFLHGAGERGTDIQKVKVHGPPKLAEKDPDFPFVVISPLCAADTWWSPAALNSMLDNIIANHRIDPARIYLTGLSMGGYGTWDWAMYNPNRFAAIVPICGGGDTTRASEISHIPIWIFHGLEDKVVAPKNSTDMFAALKLHKADVKITLYPDAGHDSWTETYDNPELYRWLMTHVNKKPGKGLAPPWRR